MNRKWLLGIIIALTLIIIISLLLLIPKTKYNKLVINSDKWNDIINTRKNSSNIKIESIKFNDYNLIIDEDESTIYYSIVDSKTKYNPIVNYKSSNFKIAFSKNLESSDIEVIIYDDENYHIYRLIITDMPILNISYNEQINKMKKIPVEIYLFDNDVNTNNKVLKTLGDLKIIKDNNEYIISLKKESLGRNRRDNNISLFGMEKHDEYLIEKTNNNSYINLFINNKYMGKYTIKHSERRDNNEK